MTKIIDAEELLVRLSQYSRDGGYINLHMGTIETIVNNTPTVEERPQGEWVYEPNLKSCTIGWFRCSYCGFKNDLHRNYNFCPTCGASMKKEGD